MDGRPPFFPRPPCRKTSFKEESLPHRLLKCHRAVLSYSATYCSGKGGSNFHRDVEQFSVTITLEVDEKHDVC